MMAHDKTESRLTCAGQAAHWGADYSVFYDPDVDIIYISTPHNTHINYLRKALSNGKHVLCEKSITLNISELDEAISLSNYCKNIKFKKSNIILFIRLILFFYIK